MKKFILIAALLSANTMAFAQFGNDSNVFGSSSNQNTTVNSNKEHMNNNNVTTVNSSRNYSTAMRAPGDGGNCTNYLQKYYEYAGNPAEQAKWRDKMIEAGCANIPGDPYTVPINGLVYPLIATALLAILTFRKKIAGILS